MTRVLIVQREEAAAVVVEHRLIQLGFEVVGTAHSESTGAVWAAALNPDLVLIDAEEDTGALDDVDAALLKIARPDSSPELESSLRAVFAWRRLA
ncbi:MAG: hypothetical protein H6737_20310 [Alphaproteobacteria bacterium]|nr:hypothetical protein [Alphaproteobacteria bacterium]